jgi:hypothetical protein
LPSLSFNRDAWRIDRGIDELAMVVGLEFDVPDRQVRPDELQLCSALAISTFRCLSPRSPFGLAACGEEDVSAGTCEPVFAAVATLPIRGGGPGIGET